jgi:hypothetical protein
MTIINYASSIINKIEGLLTDDARVIIYDCHVFIVQATEQIDKEKKFSKIETRNSPRSLKLTGPPPWRPMYPD